jgi:membrane protease subunit HflC
MKNPKFTIIAIIVFLLMILISSTIFIINEQEQAIITQFGKPIGDTITEPGIHFKIPFIQKAHTFDKRFLEWDGDPNEVPTKDKRFIWVDTYARWRITDPLLFFQRVRDERGAQTRLDDILDGETRNAIANNNLVEIIRSTNRDFQISNILEDMSDTELNINIEQGRHQIMQIILENASPRIVEFGIELLDVRLKRINYRQDVQQKIYDRMISERKRIADKFRSEGAGEAAKIIGDRERDLKQIESEAYKTAQEIIGKADAEATNIYADAYNKNTESRQFYSFLKTMETYQNTLSEKDWLILSTKSDFFKYLSTRSGR